METIEMNMDAEPPAGAVTAAVEAQNEAAVEGAKAAKKARKAGKARRKAKAQARPQERNDEMNTQNNAFAPFGAFPGITAFEKLFADAAERSEQAVQRSRKAAEELSDLYRGNFEAFVEASRIAATGAQSIAQDVAAKSRGNVEQAANSVRSFAEAKSPTELLQLQSEFARGAFDTFVEDSSSLAEQVVKLASEAFQPISSRASANVEKLNEIAA
jgi:phasin family protein